MLTHPSPPDTDEEERPSSSGILIFTVVFVLCLALFGGIGFIWWQQTQPSVPFLPNTQTTTQAASTATTTLFPSDMRKAAAIYITDDDGHLQTVTLLMLQPDRVCVTAAGIPKELSLSDTETDTLEKRYTVGGTEAAMQALKLYFNVPIDDYAVFSYSQVHSLLTAFSDGLIFTLSEDVSAQSADGKFSVHLTAGEQLLSPKQAANLLQYTDWQGGRRARAGQHAALIAAFCNQYLVKGRDGNHDLSLITGNGSSSITSAAFQAVSSPLTYLAAQNNGQICTALTTEGDFAGAGSTLQFTPSDAFINAVKDAC